MLSFSVTKHSFCGPLRNHPVDLTNRRIHLKIPLLYFSRVWFLKEERLHCVLRIPFYNQKNQKIYILLFTADDRTNKEMGEGRERETYNGCKFKFCSAEFLDVNPTSSFTG